MRQLLISLRVILEFKFKLKLNLYGYSDLPLISISRRGPREC